VRSLLIVVALVLAYVLPTVPVASVESEVEPQRSFKAEVFEEIVARNIDAPTKVAAKSVPEPVPEPQPKPQPVQANGSCASAIKQTWPAHLQRGALLVQQKEGGAPTAVGVNRNGSRDHGCFQINDASHPGFFATKSWSNPLHNAAYALSIYSGRGNWSAWYAVCPHTGGSPYGLNCG